ncbi:MAG TPA: di-heme oxidoredictase family protein [Tahibacter sp.]|nr:di-heme oxidoredictase family protein [Tahibacter sp.]
MNGNNRSTARRAPMFCALALTMSAALAQDPAITPAVTIDQNKIHDYPLAKILESGGDFHTTPFTPEDGHGEGQDGPRSKQRQLFYAQAFPNFPFLRLNGIDSQSCYECHNTIGSYVPPDYTPGSKALLRKPSPVGGSAGVASNAFINPNFPTNLTQLVRNPPHVFGTGYGQSLAAEMSTLLGLQAAIATQVAQAKAQQSGKSSTQSWALSAKGLSFGTYAVTCIPQGDCTPDASKVTGVQSDLIVRPFQWKGIASSVRHFVRDAMDFHFSMQAVEKVGHFDCDRDGKVDEMTVGNVTALASFVAMTRPPYVAIPTDPAGKKSFERGKAIFEGTAADLKGTLSGSMCATCHVPQMTLAAPLLVIENPPVPNVTDPSGCPTETTLINAVPPEQHATTKQVKARVAAILAKQASLKSAVSAEAVESVAASARSDAVLASAPPSKLDPLDLLVDLTKPGDAPAYVYPRLQAQGDGQVVVPILSDLRLHNMGSGLADSVSQGVDVSTTPAVPPPLFLTRPLWGVADTGPWLHDGRARTLKEAIGFHNSQGSEATPVIQAFDKLSPTDQQAVVNFLLAQRLPIAQDITQGATASK